MTFRDTLENPSAQNTERSSTNLAQSVPELYGNFSNVFRTGTSENSSNQNGVLDFGNQGSLYPTDFSPSARQNQLTSGDSQVQSRPATMGSTAKYVDYLPQTHKYVDQTTPVTSTPGDGTTPVTSTPGDGTTPVTSTPGDGTTPVTSTPGDGTGKNGTTIDITGNNDTVDLKGGKGPLDVDITGNNDTVDIARGRGKGALDVTVDGNNDTVNIENGQQHSGGDGGSQGSGGGDGSGDGGSGSQIGQELQQIEQAMQSLDQEIQQILQELGDGSGSAGGGGGSTGTGGDGGSGSGAGSGGTGTGGDGGSGGTGSGGTGTGGDGGSGGTGSGGGTGSADMSKIFTAGDSGVTSAEMQHAIAIADALPPDIQQALLSGGAQMTLLSGFQGGPEGENDGTQGDFYVDSGMADQAEVHELYEMAGQIDPSTLGGSWNDQTAVGLSDNAMQNIMNGSAPGGDPGDLNDTIAGPDGVNQGGQQITGNGDLMSNAFVADFFAAHPGLDQDTVGQSVLQSTDLDAPQLEAYIAQQQGLTNASSSSSLETASSSASSSAGTTDSANSAQWTASGTELAAALGLPCGCHCYLAAGQSVEF